MSFWSDPIVGRLAAAQALSQICDKLMLVGALWVLSALPDGPAWAPWFVAAGALPHLLLSGLAPRRVARWGCVPTVIGADVIRGVLLLGMAPWLSEGSPQLLPRLLAVNVAINAFGAFFNPAILALPSRVFGDAPDDAEKTRRLTAVIETCMASAGVVAPMLSVAGYAAFGLPGLVVANGTSYLIAAALEYGIPEHRPAVAAEGAGSPTAWRQLGARDPLIPALLVSFFLMNLFLGPILAFIPLYARHVYAGSLATVGWLETALGVGTVVGSLALTSGLDLRVSLPRLTGLLAAVAVAYVAFAVSGSALLGVLALAVLGLALAAMNVLLINLFQARPRPEDVPMVMSGVNLVSVASLPVSLGLVGAWLERGDATRVQPTSIALALGCLLTVAFFAGAARALESRALPMETT